jgi:S1-C subfamily serine protease
MKSATVLAPWRKYDGDPSKERRPPQYLALVVAIGTGIWSAACLSNATDSIVGTAFFVRKDGVMLTNRHVIQTCKRLFVIPEDEKRYRASVIAMSAQYDLAALMVDGYTPKSFVPLRAHDHRYVSIPTDGEEVVTGGFSDPASLNFKISIVDGVTMALPGYRERASVNAIMLSSIKRGASGSAVVDTLPIWSASCILVSRISAQLSPVAFGSSIAQSIFTTTTPSPTS